MHISEFFTLTTFVISSLSGLVSILSIVRNILANRTKVELDFLWIYYEGPLVKLCINLTNLSSVQATVNKINLTNPEFSLEFSHNLLEDFDETYYEEKNVDGSIFSAYPPFNIPPHTSKQYILEFLVDESKVEPDEETLTLSYTVNNKDRCSTITYDKLTTLQNSDRFLDAMLSKQHSDL